MEFRYRAGENRNSSSSSTSGYFAEQALRAGIVPPVMTSREEALMEELRRERMREEILAREIARNRMVEEEIRRELEFERQMSMRRFGEVERLLPFEMEARIGVGIGTGERFGSGFVMERERSVSRWREEGREWDVGCFEKPPVPRKSEVGKAKLLKLLGKSESSGSKNNNQSNHLVCGVKRKATGEIPRPTKKEWTCSLCQVTATSQKNLNKHLQGKKHQAKAAQLTDNKSTSKKSNTSSSTSKKLNTPSSMEKEADADTPFNKAKNISANKPTKKMNTEEKKKQQLKGPKSLWCDLCKVQCNTQSILDCHLKGKKHMSQLNLKKGDGVGSGATEIVKEVTEQQKPEKEVKVEGNAEATNLKKVKKR